MSVVLGRRYELLRWSR